MSKRFIIALVAVIAVGLCGWAFAQQGQPTARKTDAEGGRFAISSVGTSAVMIEITSGKTWVLRHSADGRSAAWLPVERIDDPKKAEMWLEREEALKQELAKRRDQN